MSFNKHQYRVGNSKILLGSLESIIFSHFPISSVEEMGTFIDKKLYGFVNTFIVADAEVRQWYSLALFSRYLKFVGLQIIKLFGCNLVKISGIVGIPRFYQGD